MRHLAAVLLAFVVATPALGVDLTQHYQATLDFFQGQPTREWTCTPQDVWKLSSFHYNLDDKLAIDCGPSTVIFGVHDRNVVWAAVIPDAPGKVTTTLPAGNGDGVASIWMRFNPLHLATLFPAETVIGNGPAAMTTWGKRLCTWKISSGWQAGNLPVIPMKNSLVFDIDTPQRVRHYYMVDLDKQNVQRVDAFSSRALPATVAMTPEQSLGAFDAVWDAFDKEYAKFVIRPALDWKAARDRHRPRAAEAKSSYEAAAAISALLEELKDLHVYVRAGDEFIPGYNRPRPLNANLDAVRRGVQGWTQNREGLIWGRTDDGIGYINVYALGSRQLPAAFDEVLESLGDTWGLMLDLRFNGGGDELLARDIAGRFLDQQRVYSMNQYRGGPAHTDLGPKLERAFTPRGPWRYASPVVALLGQRTMSSAESFALMLAQCPNVTTMGDRTAGSSANPRRLELEGGIIVNLPRWIDLDPAGESIEDVGVQPDVMVDAKPEEFTPTTDPVFDKALERLRQVPQADRHPGKR